MLEEFKDVETARISQNTVPDDNLEHKTVSITSERYGFRSIQCNAEGRSDRRTDSYSKETNELFEEQERNLQNMRDAAKRLGVR